VAPLTLISVEIPRDLETIKANEIDRRFRVQAP
jgi:hypothetical protein